MLPVTSRQRKHIYMHSEIFADQGPSHQSLYGATRQRVINDQIERTLAIPRPENPRMPSPMDLKATANFGHNVLHGPQSNGFQCVSPRNNGYGPVYHKLGKGDKPILVVQSAKQDDGAIPREQWWAGTNLTWNDVRLELCRRQYVGGQAQTLDAGSMKAYLLSSEVLGCARKQERSTRSPSREIRALDAGHFNNVDSRLDPQVRGSTSQECLGPPASARKTLNLCASTNSPFMKSGAEQSPIVATPRPRFGLARSDDVTAEDRRRAERNYSDLNLNPATSYSMPRSTIRSDIMDTANCHFLDSHLEKASQNTHREAPQVNAHEVSQPDAVICLSPRPTSPRRSNEEETVAAQERACWDDRNIMGQGAEVNRRLRERLSCGGSEARARSPQERQRFNQASSQFKTCAGQRAPAWADGELPPGSAFLAPSMAARSGTMSPDLKMRDARSVSPRIRKLASLQSSIVF